tara:strand:+ start:249 stop:518 length:270 start_codon:yes stop_codon:yes gene_type:complete
MKYKQLSITQTNNKGDTMQAQWFASIELWRVLLNVDGVQSTLNLSSVETKSRDPKQDNRLQSTKRNHALSSLWHGVKAWGFSKAGSVQL